LSVEKGREIEREAEGEETWAAACMEVGGAAARARRWGQQRMWRGQIGVALERIGGVLKL
jgi:hypothetical protein